MRTAVQLAGLVLALGGLTTGCGGGDDDDSDAKSSSGVTTKEFCTEFNSLYTKALTGIDRTDPQATIKATKAWADDMDDLGAPKGMPADAREGFDVFIDTIEDVDDDASAEDLAKLGQDLPKDKQQAGEKFGDWTKENCPVESTEPSPSPSSS